MLIFQSTFPRGERRKVVSLKVGNKYFNPRSRVGNDLPCGRTIPHRLDFNPRSRVGNDVGNALDKAIEIDFNPRSRVGNDCSRDAYDLVMGISIHVPAWGTTKSCACKFPIFSNFNPRSRVGNDYDER